MLLASERSAEHSSLISNTGFLTSWPPLPSVGFPGFEIICAAFCCRIHGASVTSMTKLTERAQQSWVSAPLGLPVRRRERPAVFSKPHAVTSWTVLGRCSITSWCNTVKQKRRFQPVGIWMIRQPVNNVCHQRNERLLCEFSQTVASASLTSVKSEDPVYAAAVRAQTNERVTS